MRWWDNVLYDTCSLVSLYEVNAVYPGFETHFPSILTIPQTLDRESLDPRKGSYFRKRATLFETPDAEALAETIRKGKLSRSLSSVDVLLYATAVERKTKVITGDIPLAKALRKKNLLAGNMALALRSLVVEGKISRIDCAQILSDLAAKGEYLIRPNSPQSWESLEDYHFP